MVKVTFNSVFTKHRNGSLEPKQRVRVGGVEFGPGVHFGKGVSFAGIDFTQFEGRDFEVDIDKDIMVLKGVY